MATTTNFGFNTPDNTAYVKDGASAMRTLGDNIDARFGNVATYPNQIVNVVSGVSRPVPYAMACGSAFVNNFSAITFPAGRFTQAPRVVTTVLETGALVAPAICEIVSVTTAVANLHFTTTSHGANLGDINFIAIQMTSAAASG